MLRFEHLSRIRLGDYGTPRFDLVSLSPSLQNMALLFRALLVSSVGQTVSAFACVPYLRIAKSPHAFAINGRPSGQLVGECQDTTGIQPATAVPLSRVPYLDGRHLKNPQDLRRRHRWSYQRTDTEKGKRGTKMQYKKHRGYCKCVSFAPHGGGSEHLLTRDSDARVVTNLHTTSPTFPVCFLYYFPRPPPPLYRNTPPLESQSF